MWHSLIWSILQLIFDPLVVSSIAACNALLGTTSLNHPQEAQCVTFAQLHPPHALMPPLFPPSPYVMDSVVAPPTGSAARRPLSPATSRSCSGSPPAALRAGPARSAGSCPRARNLRSCSFRSGGCWTSRCSPAGHTPLPGSPTAVRRYLRFLHNLNLSACFFFLSPTLSRSLSHAHSDSLLALPWGMGTLKSPPTPLPPPSLLP